MVCDRRTDIAVTLVMPLSMFFSHHGKDEGQRYHIWVQAFCQSQGLCAVPRFAYYVKFGGGFSHYPFFENRLCKLIAS